jgi:excinuclease ABC subunit C
LAIAKAHAKVCKHREDYDVSIASIKEIIKGNLQTINRQLKELMMDYAEKMEFEKAHLIKEKLVLLEKFQSKSTVVNPAISNVDVFLHSSRGIILRMLTL